MQQLYNLDSTKYHFLRLGEEDGDKEEWGEYYDSSFQMTWERRIDFQSKNTSTLKTLLSLALTD